MKNSLMNLNVDQKYVSIWTIHSFDYPVGCVIGLFRVHKYHFGNLTTRQSCAHPYDVWHPPRRGLDPRFGTTDLKYLMNNNSFPAHVVS